MIFFYMAIHVDVMSSKGSARMSLVQTPKTIFWSAAYPWKASHTKLKKAYTL